jgi:hypothetical protein
MAATLDGVKDDMHGARSCPACGESFPNKSMYMRHARYSTTCTAEDRFWARVDKSGRCWLFQGATDKWGYGHVGHGGRRVQAHRYAFLIAKGDIPAGQLVLHKCDTPLCVRPDHLFLGSDADNRADCVSKGRQAWGERTNRNTLTEELVRKIREEWRVYSPRKTNAEELAAKYGVRKGTIYLAATGRTWSYLK